MLTIMDCASGAKSQANSPLPSQQRSLEPETRCASFVKGLDQPIHLTAYLSADLPAELATVAGEVARVLGSLRSSSGGAVTFDIVDPAKQAASGTTTDIFGRTVRAKTAVEQDIEALGIFPIAYRSEEEGKLLMRNGYLAVAGKKGDRSAIAPKLVRAEEVEFEIARLIYRLKKPRPTAIGFVVGHGEVLTESDRDRLSEMVAPDFSLVAVDLSGISANGPLPAVEALVIAGNTSPYPDGERAAVERWIASGRPVSLLLRSVVVDLDTFAPTVNNHGWTELLGGFGIRVGGQVVLDAQCAMLGAKTRHGEFEISTPTKYPPVPSVQLLESSHLGREVFQLPMPFATPLFLENVPADLNARVIASSTKQSMAVAASTEMLDPHGRLTGKDMSLGGPYPLLVTLEGRHAARSARIAIVGSADLLREQFMVRDGSNFLLNLLEWMTFDTCLLRT